MFERGGILAYHDRYVPSLPELGLESTPLETALQDVDDRLQLVRVVGNKGQCQLLLVPVDLRSAAAEIEPSCDLLGRLLDGVGNLLQVHLADGVERELLGHGTAFYSERRA